MARPAIERQVVENRESLVVAQVDELTCTDFYGPGGSSSSSRLTSLRHGGALLAGP